MSNDEIENVPSLLQALVESIRSYSSCAIAFSGGVDSSVVAKGAFEAIGNKAIAITGVGPSVSQEDLRIARQVAESIGIRHVTLETAEINDPAYLANDARRCFHCKSNLYERLGNWARENGIEVILSGTNRDDLGDYRPGLEAARDYRVISPLADLGIGKKMVRELAKHWGLPVADRPASPCLASRIAYGESVTVAKLQRIELAEQWLSENGFCDVRVRLHPGDLARIEVSDDDLARLFQADRRQALVARFRKLGFQFITIDAAGRQSGSLNRLLPTVYVQPIDDMA